MRISVIASENIDPVRDFEQNLRLLGEAIVEGGQSNFPEFTGRLRQSWRVTTDITGGIATLEVSAEGYAYWLEHGFSPAQFDEFMQGNSPESLKEWFMQKLGKTEEVAWFATKSTLRKWEREGKRPGRYLDLDSMSDLFDLI